MPARRRPLAPRWFDAGLRTDERPAVGTLPGAVKTLLMRAFLALVVGVAAVLLAGSAAAAAAQKRVLAIEFENDVNPVTANYVTGEIDRANNDGYDAVVILLDTPGGLSESMRKIYKRELASKIPVIVYVSPPGARAASAGVWIGQAADVLAMAPGTNIGSSTPINVGGENIQKDLRRKVVNDAAASLRELARTHGRNVQWADAAVRKASNLGAAEALRMNVIDFMAPTLPALLAKTDGYKTVPKGFVLDLKGAQIDNVQMSLWQRILDTIIDPNIIVLLMSVGVLGIVVEIWAPGHIFPGAIGAISLIIGLFGLSVLPISWAGILLMILAAGFFGAEPFVPSHGALTLAGAASFVIGSLLLFEPAGSAYQVSLPVVIAIAATISLFMAFAVTKIVQIRRRPATTGVQAIVGEHGVVRRDGYVQVRGELWRAHTTDDEPLPPGQEIEVEAIEDGLTLAVRPVESANA
jgi:membrane-bound serine protease (ClpP class)